MSPMIQRSDFENGKYEYDLNRVNPIAVDKKGLHFIKIKEIWHFKQLDILAFNTGTKVEELIDMLKTKMSDSDNVYISTVYNAMFGGYPTCYVVFDIYKKVDSIELINELEEGLIKLQ